MGLLVYLVIAGIAGFIGMRLLGGGGGAVISVVAGLVGVWLGDLISGLIGGDGIWVVGGVDVVWAIIGTAVLMFILRLLPKAWLLKLGARS